ncbi:MAG: hypothetical protein ORN83_13055, partial [Chthoniobacteraceae bacterium]|nr:hypothetical protein [Chthoniobacteraceae bacterium]
VLDRGEAVAHVRPREAFFTPAVDAKGANLPREASALVRFVKPDVYEKGRAGESAKKKARDFLERVGVRNYDERAEIERRLEAYPKSSIKFEADYFSDVRLFITYLKRHPSQAEMFRGKRFLLGSKDPRHGWSWISPSDIFLDNPYETTGLAGLTAIHHKWTLWPDYLERLGRELRQEDIAAFLKTVGAFVGLTIYEFKNWENKSFNYALGRHTDTGCNVDWEIQGLIEYLRVKNVAASRLVWTALLQADRKVAVARYTPNRQYEVQQSASRLVTYLRLYPWIPDQHGAFYRPQDMTQDMLPKEFPFDDSKGLLTAIGFGEKANAASAEFRTRDADAKRLGFESVQELAEALGLLQAKRE